jgi:hypothetical protein
VQGYHISSQHKQHSSGYEGDLTNDNTHFCSNLNTSSVLCRCQQLQLACRHTQPDPKTPLVPFQPQHWGTYPTQLHTLHKLACSFVTLQHHRLICVFVYMPCWPHLTQERMEFLKEDLMHLFDDQGVDESQ